MAGRDLVSEDDEGVGDDDQYHYAWPPPADRCLHGVFAGNARSYPGDMGEDEARMIWGDALIDMINADNANPANPANLPSGYTLHRATTERK